MTVPLIAAVAFSTTVGLRKERVMQFTAGNLSSETRESLPQRQRKRSFSMKI